MIGKFGLEIVYCVPWGHHAVATWMVSEFFKEFGVDAAITMTPEEGGRLEVYVNGDKIFDKKALGNVYPSLTHVREMKAAIKSKVGAAIAAN